MLLGNIHQILVEKHDKRRPSAALHTGGTNKIPEIDWSDEIYKS